MLPAKTITVLLVDSHIVVRNGIAKILGGYTDFEVVGQAGTIPETLNLCDIHQPNVVILDLLLPHQNEGIETLEAIIHKHPKTRVVVLTTEATQVAVQHALHSGAFSYLLKYVSSEELVHAIRAANQGRRTLSPEVTRILIHAVTTSPAAEYDLTPREIQVLKLIVKGLNNRDIAKKLNVTLSTVQFHVSNILAKLGVHTRIEAAMIALQQALVEKEDAQIG